MGFFYFLKSVSTIIIIIIIVTLQLYSCISAALTLKRNQICHYCAILLVVIFQALQLLYHVYKLGGQRLDARELSPTRAAGNYIINTSADIFQIRFDFFFFRSTKPLRGFASNDFYMSVKLFYFFLISCMVEPTTARSIMFGWVSAMTTVSARSFLYLNIILCVYIAITITAHVRCAYAAFVFDT